ncbi:MAG: hypothetical protein HY756_05330 [Nitrospirae bacterium]|nr:hypothetical protein [Nitrospirota bacterium]
MNLAKTLREQYYDMVIDLQGLLRSGLMTFFARSPLKIGFENAREGSRFFYDRKIKVDKDMHAVDRCLEVVKEMQKGQGSGVKKEGKECQSVRVSKCQSRDYRAQNTEHREEKIEFPLYIDDASKENVKKLLGDLTEYVVIVPSARWQTKRWPTKYFGMLISRLSIPCVITGGNDDKELAYQVMNSSEGKGINVSGKLNLKELSALIAGSKAVVSADSGPLHIAVALGIPVVALFGPTDPQRTGPYGWQANKKIKVLRASVSCSPCFKKECENPICMNEISVESVFEGVREYL